MCVYARAGNLLSIPAERRVDDGRDNKMHDVYTKLDHDLGIRHAESGGYSCVSPFPLITTRGSDERHNNKCAGNVWQAASRFS